MRLPRFCIRVLPLALAIGAGFAAEPAPAPPKPAGTFVAVGYGGRRIASRDGYTWENDQRWSDREVEDDDTLLDIAFGLGRFIAVGGGPTQGRIVASGDGVTWKELPALQGRVSTVAFGNRRFVASHGAELLISTDGERFLTGPSLDWAGTVNPRRCAAGDTEAGFRFVLIGDVDLTAEQKRVFWRAATGDGSTFLHTALETAPARDIAYGAGHFVIVGPGGLIESSHDGQTWQRHNVGVTDGFSRIIWNGQRFVVSGGRRTWTSPDGKTWTPEATRTPGSLAWAREGWLWLGLAWGGQMQLATRLGEWKAVALPAGPSLNAIAFGADPAE